ncbi:LysR substrate-binding domain-containing protein [Solimonas marina]|uniref:LysR substrate-binding domain-containing protein n=1 Tax=Solimonas marina TaxID=2714601 RepID=A0A969WAK5_9GAMM|nr:LysR substrate-binding domain-containing protein [Solimonas marina]NKF23846.1 hypothetical protein [Solimonas marina]
MRNAIANRFQALLDPRQYAARPTVGLMRGGADPHWTLVTGNGERLRVTHRPGLLYTDLRVLFEAALGGIDIALLPLRIVWPALEQGTLIRRIALDDRRSGIHMPHAQRRETRPSVRALIEFLAA